MEDWKLNFRPFPKPLLGYKRAAVEEADLETEDRISLERAIISWECQFLLPQETGWKGLPSPQAYWQELQRNHLENLIYDPSADRAKRWENSWRELGEQSREFLLGMNCDLSQKTKRVSFLWTRCRPQNRELAWSCYKSCLRGLSGVVKRPHCWSLKCSSRCPGD